MKILYGSDLHLELDEDTEFDQISFEECDVLILAGDVLCSSMEFPVRFFEKACENAGQVLYIPGNHEFYSNGEYTYQDSLEIIGNKCSKFKNLLFGVNIVKDIYGTRFVGATLWTDLQKGKYTDFAKHRMNDYRQCKNLTPEFTTQLHKADLNHIKAYVDQYSVVFTHHAPSKKSTHPRYAADIAINSCYSTDVIINLDIQPEVWIHGHTHDEFFYTEGDTKVLAKPRGYWGYETSEKYYFGGL